MTENTAIKLGPSIPANDNLFTLSQGKWDDINNFINVFDGPVIGIMIVVYYKATEAKTYPGILNFKPKQWKIGSIELDLLALQYGVKDLKGGKIAIPIREQTEYYETKVKSSLKDMATIFETLGQIDIPNKLNEVLNLLNKMKEDGQHKMPGMQLWVYLGEAYMDIQKVSTKTLNTITNGIAWLSEELDDCTETKINEILYTLKKEADCLTGINPEDVKQTKELITSLSDINLSDVQKAAESLYSGWSSTTELFSTASTQFNKAFSDGVTIDQMITDMQNNIAEWKAFGKVVNDWNTAIKI